MGLIRFLFYALVISILFLALFMVMVGEIWLLRILLIWLFDFDLVKEVKKWLR